MLPSISRRYETARRRYNPMSVNGDRTLKKNNREKLSKKDIICLPYEYHHLDGSDNNKHNLVPIPRGKSRQKLCSLGLMAKLTISIFHTPQKVAQETSRLFKECFNWPNISPKILNLTYLSCYSGTKCLTVTTVSEYF